MSANALKPTGKGKLVLFSNHKAFLKAKKSAENKVRSGIQLVPMSAEECLKEIPALAGWTDSFAGGIFSPDDEALDTQVFCNCLKTVGQSKFNVTYKFHETVQRLVGSENKITGIVTDKSEYEADMIVICLGGASKPFLAQADIHLPTYPMQGYSLTLPATSKTPQTSLTDIENKIVFANLGSKVRIAGFMDTNQKPGNESARCEQLLQTARHLWPKIADYDSVPNFWTHYRPMMPSGVPMIGPSKLDGLYVNAGHGSLGYTFALGSAQRITNMIGGHNLARSKAAE